MRVNPCAIVVNPRGATDVRFGSLADITASFASCLFYSQQRTFGSARGMSEKCQ